MSVLPCLAPKLVVGDEDNSLAEFASIHCLKRFSHPFEWKFLNSRPNTVLYCKAEGFN
jgi:hypothetical protein